MIGTLLEMDGHTLRYATNYNDALALVEEEDFDLVITDYSMPRMHGLYLIDMIKSAQPAMPVILITAFPKEDIMADAARKGADLVLIKPFEYEALADGIRKLRKKWRNRSGTPKRS